MPCRDDFADQDARDALVKKVNELTMLLCLHCSKFPPTEGRVKEWWEKHKAEDAARKKREREEAEYQKRVTAWEAQRPRRKT